MKQGQPLLTATRSGRKVPLVSPLDGEVRAVNPGGKDEYLVVLRPTRLKANMAQMKGYAEADGWIHSELSRFKDFITLRMGSLQEVGQPWRTVACTRKASSERWTKRRSRTSRRSFSGR